MSNQQVLELKLAMLILAIYSALNNYASCRATGNPPASTPARRGQGGPPLKQAAAFLGALHEREGALMGIMQS